MVIPLEQALEIAKRTNNAGKLAAIEANFITNRLIPFHIGIRNSHPESRKIINHLEMLIDDLDWEAKKSAALKNYRP